LLSRPNNGGQLEKEAQAPNPRGHAQRQPVDLVVLGWEFSVTLRIMSKATYDDVNLILKLYELRREDKMRAARNWFYASFKCKSMAEFGELCPPGSDSSAFMRQVTSYWDMAASFVTAGVLNDELLFQSNRELLVVWMRMEPIIAELRAAFKDPNYMKHLETVGRSYAEFLNRTNPETYHAFKARVGG
jgi:hypothetical protein